MPTSIAATPTTSSASYDLAIADYTEAIKLDPNDPDVYNNRGQAYDNKGEFDLAIADYTAAIRLDSEDARAYYNRGLTRTNKGEFEQARSPTSTRPSSSPRAMRMPMRVAAGPTRNWATTLPPRPTTSRALQLDPDNEDAKEGLERLRT